MDAVVLFFKSYLLPGSMSLLLLGLMIGVGLLFAGERGKRWGRAWLITLLASYWVLATPAFATSLEGLLSRGYTPIESAGQAEGAQAIVVLSGGSASVDGPEGRIDALSSVSAIRLLEGARLYRMLQNPWVVLSGGPPGDDSTATPEAVAMQRELVRQGIPPERIVVEMASEDTHAQAQRIKPVLASHGVDEFVLVTSGWHLPRSMGAFRREGMTPIASAAEGRSVGGEEAGLALLPSESALSQSRVMAREVLALLYYRLRGWI